MPPPDDSGTAPTMRTGTVPGASAGKANTSTIVEGSARSNTTRDALVALANTIVVCHAGGVITADAITRTALMLSYAVVYADHGWRVFPVKGKNPAIRGGRGVLDATTDIPTICRWWAGRYRACSIGGRLPDAVFVLDVDPRDGGYLRLDELMAAHGSLPTTLMTVTGSRGLHYFFRRPAGIKLKTSVFGPKTGLDIKDSRGYVILPPSLHRDTRKPYAAVDAPIVAAPDWLIELIAVPLAPLRAERSIQEKFFAGTGRGVMLGDSPADIFTDSTSWSDVLEPHGWVCKSADPDADGAVWLHPTHTSSCSATVRDGCLFVWSTNTPFEPSATGDPHGYTRFRAYAVLNFNGSLSAAASSLRKVA